MDLPWRGPYGVVGARVADRTVRFLRRYAERFAYLFVSWQPPDRGVPKLADVAGPWDALFDAVPIRHRALHQTALNLAAGPGYARGPVVALTNQLAERYGFAWVNEDLGHWSVRGRPLPYPQPPALSAAGIAACVRACTEVRRALEVPLVVEFPGFETPAPWLEGTLDAYDVFREVVERADVLCNLDTGHLLTWRWLQGHRGEELLDGLERLPLDRCVEIHCAGTHEAGGALVDAHHGVLSDAQLALTEALLARCPALRVVTWEDPRFDDAGALPPRLDASLAALEARVSAWTRRSPEAAPPGAGTRGDPIGGRGDADGGGDGAEASLAAVWQAPSAFGRRCRAQIPIRATRGVGRIVDLYPAAIAAWRAAHPDDADPDLDGLIRAFLAANDAEGWSDIAWAVPGRCLEDAFGRFVAPGSAEHLTACARVLAVHPELVGGPPFTVPDGFRRAPGGWFAVAGSPPVLYAAVGGRLVTGTVTDAIVDLLRDPERRRPGDPVAARLAALGLV